MPASMHRQTKRITPVGFFLLVLVASTLALAVYTYWISVRQAQAATWVNHTQEVLTALAETRTALGDATRAARSYVNTGDDHDLVPYNNAIARIKSGFEHVRVLTVDNPSQQVRLEGMNAALQTLLSNERAIVDTRRAQGLRAAQILADADITEKLVDVVQAELGGIGQRERESLRERISDEQNAVQRIKVSAAVLVALMGIVIALLYWTIRRQRTAELQAAGDDLRHEMDERGRVQESLRHSESRLQAILESAMDAIITVDERERIVLFNTAAEEVFGCPRDQALGAPLAWFIPERFRAGHAEHIRRFGEERVNSRRMGMQRVVTGLRRNGVEFPIDASISRVAEGSRKFYTVILRDVTARVQAEETLRNSRDQLREFAEAASTVREQEKRRVARELHDELAQDLTALKMDLGWAQERLAPNQEQIKSKFEVMHALVDGAVVATRRIAADLRPPILDELGLVPAAEWLVQNFMKRHNSIHCELAVDPPHFDLRDPHATAIFRILQESLTNVARHAHASLVQISLDGNGGEVALRIRDNGRGFEPGSPRNPGSLGLVGLRERAYLLGGEIVIDTAPGKGTVIEVHVPLQQVAAQ